MKTLLSIIKRRREEGASSATIRRDLTAVSSVLDYAEDQDYREGNPALARLRKLKERRDPLALAHHADIERVACRADLMLAALTRTALATGCRQNELVHAERRLFDPERRQLTVRAKRNKIRTIDLDDATVALLRSLPICLGCKWLFWHSDGEPFRGVASTFRYVVRAEHRAAQKAAQEAGHRTPDFRPFRFHDLRHRFAVDWLKSGRSLYDLQQHLGHTSIKTTEMYLVHLTAEEQRIVKGDTTQSTPQSKRFTEARSA